MGVLTGSMQKLDIIAGSQSLKASRPSLELQGASSQCRRPKLQGAAQNMLDKLAPQWSFCPLSSQDTLPDDLKGPFYSQILCPWDLFKIESLVSTMKDEDFWPQQINEMKEFFMFIHMQNKNKRKC